MWGWTRSTAQGLFPEHDTLLVPLQRHGMNSVIFLVPGGLVHRPDLAMPEAQFLSYIQLIHALGADQPVYGLRRLGLGDILKSYRSLEDLAARYVNAVLAFQPHGPYLFVGDCVGGHLRIRDRETTLPSAFEGSRGSTRYRISGHIPQAKSHIRTSHPRRNAGPQRRSRQQDPKELESARCHGWPFYLQWYIHISKIIIICSVSPVRRTRSVEE